MGQGIPGQTGRPGQPGLQGPPGRGEPGPPGIECPPGEDTDTTTMVSGVSILLIANVIFIALHFEFL